MTSLVPIYTDIRIGKTWTMETIVTDKDIYGRNIKPQTEMIVRQNGQSITLSRFQVQTILKYLIEQHT